MHRAIRNTAQDTDQRQQKQSEGKHREEHRADHWQQRGREKQRTNRDEGAQRAHRATAFVNCWTNRIPIVPFDCATRTPIVSRFSSDPRPSWFFLYDPARPRNVTHEPARLPEDDRFLGAGLATSMSRGSGSGLTIKNAAYGVSPSQVLRA